jgi:hypothetical protein
MEVSGQLHAPASLPQEKELLYPLDRRLSGPHSWSGLWGVEKTLLPCQDSNNSRPAHSKGAILLPFAGGWVGSRDSIGLLVDVVVKKENLSFSEIEQKFSNLSRALNDDLE